MVKKHHIVTIALSSLMSIGANAYTDAEIVSAIKTKPVNVELIRQMVSSDSFNPYRKINGSGLAELAERYDNTYFSRSVTVKQLNLSDKAKKLDYHGMISEAATFDVNKLNLILATGADINTVSTYLKSTNPNKQQINSVDANGNSPLATTILTSDPRGRSEIIKLLVTQYSADVDAQNVGEHLDTPFSAACRSGNVTDMATLLILGANWFLPTGNDEQILTIAKKSVICSEIINKILK